MDKNLKWYVLGALTEEENESDENRIFIGESPYEDFYMRVAGRSVDVEEEGYENIPEVEKYFEEYTLRPEQLQQITYLGLEPGNSVYENLICPQADEGTEVHSLEGIQQLPNLETILMNEMRSGSLEPLVSLEKLKEIVNLPILVKDYSPLLRIPSLKKLSISGCVNVKEFAARLEVLEQLKEKGVEIQNRLDMSKSSGTFGGL